MSDSARARKKEWRDAGHELPYRSDEHMGYLFRSFGQRYRAGLFDKLLLTKLASCRTCLGHIYKSDLTELVPLGIGNLMEQTVQLLKAVNNEVKESQDILEELHNQIVATNKIVQPELAQMVREIRDSRMAVVAELRHTLTMLQDVRTFFLGSDYEKEMQRLERFTAACNQLRELKADGTLDAVCDVILKLAVKE